MHTVRFVDSHVHLCEYADPEPLLAYARATETLLVSTSVDRESSLRTLALSGQEVGQVLGFVGVHPSEAEKSDGLGWLESAIQSSAGLGEVGLDPKYSSSEEGSKQEEVFRGQLRIADRAAKPVQVHSRGAESRCLEILDEASFRTNVLLHWFQGEASVADATDKGYFLSFGPALLSSKKLQRMALRAGPTQILTETDGPVPFHGLGGGKGAPLMPSVVFKLGEIFHVRFEEMRETVLGNSYRYLGATGKG